MAGLLGRLFGRHADAGCDDPDLMLAIERAVVRVDPRLQMTGGYPARYKRAVATALDYVREVASSIPGPVEMSPEHYVSDPLVHALFSSPGDMQHALCMSHAMHEYRKRPEGVGDTVYAMMGMRRQEKSAFGIGGNGDLLSREVAQTVVVFSDHTLSGPAPSEDAARNCLMWSLFDSLVERVVDRIKQRRDEKSRLEKERDYLMAHLRSPDEGKRQAARQGLDQMLADLAEATKRLDLGHLAEDFDDVMLSPRDYLRLEEANVSLDGMGVKCTDAGEGVCHALRFWDLHGRDRRRWTVMMVCCHPRPELVSMADRLQEANRWLEI